MNPSLLRFLRCPATGELLELHSFTPAGTPGGDDIAEGLLVSKDSRHVYAIHAGVPIMLERGLPTEFASRHSDRIAEIVGRSGVGAMSQARPWSFSLEWQTDVDLGLERTWGFTTDSRLEQMMLETNRPREWFREKLVLDAGCGNGRLTDRITDLGAEAIGIDYSESVFRAHARRRSQRVHYVRGDLQRPPFAQETFDAVISNGVLHHTPSTEHTFAQVARCVKPDGVFYIWLYSLPEHFARRYLEYGLFDLARWMTSRLPDRAARAVARGGAHLARMKYRVLGPQRALSTDELTVLFLDALTPRWQHRHRPAEVARWYFEAGFSAPLLTHWDNPYGFGVVGEKRPTPAMPGVHFDQQQQLVQRSA